MTVDYLIKLFKNCEYIKNFYLDAGFLSDKVNSVSIVPDGDEEIIREYADGARIKGYSFSLIIRLPAVMGNNLQNLTLLENICKWISSVNPPEETECIPLGMSVIQGATLYDDNIHSLKYRIRCRFNYLQEKENYNG